MKNSFIFFLAFFIHFTAKAQTSPALSNLAKEEVLQLKETQFDFGKIPQGKPVTHIFEVINNGKTPLVLENVQASCGCTTPEWSRQPIEPGASKQITVGYNSASEGPFEKSITIFYNKGQMKNLMIRGNVWKTPDQSVPKNNSIAIFKN